MTKINFLSELKGKLSGLPKDEIENSLSFYDEMIIDRMEDGMSEEEAVDDVGDVDEIAEQIIADTPITKLVKEKIKKSPAHSMKWWEITLLAVGSPVWASLLIAALAVILSLYASAWAVIASIWAVFGAFAGGALGGVASGVIFITTGSVASGVATIGAGIFLSGLSVFTFYGCRAATKGILRLTKIALCKIKKCFMKKEASK